MHNASSNRRTIFESQTTRIRQSLRPGAFAATFIAVGLIALSSGGSGPFLSWQGSSATARVDANQPAPRDKLLQDGWILKVEHSGGIPPRQGQGLLGKREGGEGVDGGDALQRVQDRNGCMQSRQRSLRQLGDIPVQYQSTAPQGGSVKDGGTTQIVLSLSKQYTDKSGWEAAELAPRVSARRWLRHRGGVEVHDVRPPTRIAGREKFQVVAQIASSSYDGALRASGTDGVMTRSFFTTEEITSSVLCFYLWISRWKEPCGLGSEARGRCNCCRTRRGVAEGALDVSTEKAIVWYTLSVCMGTLDEKMRKMSSC